MQPYLQDFILLFFFRPPHGGLWRSSLGGYSQAEGARYPPKPFREQLSLFPLCLHILFPSVLWPFIWVTCLLVGWYLVLTYCCSLLHRYTCL